MKNINLIEDNIDNLTGLWQTAGTPFLSYVKNDTFECCKIENSDWPNKLWLRGDIWTEKLPEIIETLKANPGLVIPYWDIFGSNSDQILKAHGLQVKSRQVAMVLELKEKFNFKTQLTFKKVWNEKEAKIWSDLYPHAFGYAISKEILLQNYQNISFYLVEYNAKAIGTFMLFETGKTIGIHGVGVIPEMRRKGFAEEIMKFVLNLALDLDMKYAQLQASPMGKDIYTRLGFEDLFVIKNYFLNSNL